MAVYVYTLGLLAVLLSLADYASASSMLFCASCPEPVRNVHDCQHFHNCHHNEVCAVSRALSPHGHNLYHFYCAAQDECDAKHAQHMYPHDTHLQCIDCCSSDNCNRDLCHGDSHGNMPMPHTPQPSPTSPQLGPHSCATCQGIADPKLCHQFKECHRSQECFTEVWNNLYYMSCQESLNCMINGFANLFGKRRRSASDQEDVPGITTCRQCCSVGNGCNRILCPTTNPPPTTTASTTTSTTPTTATTTTTLPTTTVTTTRAFTATKQHSTTTQGTTSDQCHDSEEDGISCSSLDLLHICSDPSTLAYVLARQKCPKHCGFCKSTTQTSPVHVTPPPAGVCADYEQDGIKCSSLDLFHLCTGTSTLEYVIAHKKCSKHCGFCTPTAG